ncbi:MAG: hypothetical protein JNJ41_08575 [Bacteroidia bacterium]|nr:hypothetical protein [Bacteroidia bacterium]
MRTLLLLLILTTKLFGQPVDLKVNGGKIDIYKDALIHYIDSIHNRGKLTFDTLFILNNDEFPDSCARKTEGVIKKINVVFLDRATMSDRLKYQSSLIALNMAANQNLGKEKINILIYTFRVTQGKTKILYTPVRPCTVRYIYNNSKKEFEFHKITWEN